MAQSSASGHVLEIDHSQDAPVEYVQLAQHPFTDEQCRDLQDVAERIEICIPRCFFKDNAKSWNQLNVEKFGGCANTTLKTLQLFGYIANRVPKRGSKKEDFAAAVVHFSAVAKLPDPDAQLEQSEEDAISAVLMPPAEPPTRRCEEANIVAFRLRVTMQTRMWAIGALVDDLITDNEKALKKSLRQGHKRQKKAREFEYSTITREEYLRLCVAYIGDESITENPHVLALELWDINNPINPVNVFTVERSMEIAARLGAEPVLCDIDNYVETLETIPMTITCPDVTAFTESKLGPIQEPPQYEEEGGEDGESQAQPAAASGGGGGARPKRNIVVERLRQRIRFPCEGWNVYRIGAQFLHPMQLSRYFFPHLRKPIVGTSEEKEMYTRLLGHSHSVYKACVNITAGSAEANNLSNLSKRMMQRYASIPASAKGSLYNEHVMFQMEIGLKEWQTIYNLDCKDEADSIKAIIRWDKEFLSRNKNFSQPLPLQSKNLSRIGNFFAHLNLILDTVFGITHLNCEIMSGWVGDMHVFFETPFHAHLLLTGAQSGGKSKVLEVMMRLLIPETYAELAYESDKAKANSDHSLDKRVEFFPEIPPPMLGVSLGGPADSAAHTTQQALLKMRLTTGRMPSQVRQQTEAGGFETKEQIGYCNIKFNGACNVVSNLIPKPTASRFYISTISSGNVRADKQTPMEKTARLDNPAVKHLMETLILRMQVMQSLCSKVMTLISGGVLPGVHMGVVISVLMAVLKEGKLRGLGNCNEVRSMERVLFHTQVIAIVDAIDLVFHSEVSPIKDKAYHPKQLLLVRPYLCAKVEHLAIALSLLEKEFESPTDEPVLEALKRMFPVKRRPGGLERQMGELRLDGQGGFQHAAAPAAAPAAPADYDPFQGGNALPPSSIDPKHYAVVTYEVPQWVLRSTGDAALRAVLARELLAVMQPTPPVEVIKLVLRDLTSNLVSAGDPANPALTVPILKFALNQRGLAWTTLEQQSKTERLAQCFIDVMSYEGALEQTFVYAKSNPQYPYVVKTIRNDPSRKRPPILMHDPDYFDQTLRRFTRNFTEGVFHAPLIAEQSTHVDWKRVFSDTADMVVQCDADELNAYRHCESAGIALSWLETMKLPSFVAKTQHAECLATYDSLDHMDVYPRCFIASMSGESRQRREADRIHASDVLGALKEKLQTDLIKQREYERRKRRRSDLDDDDDEVEMADVSQRAAAAVVAAVPDEDMRYCDADLQHDIEQNRIRAERERDLAEVNDDDWPELDPEVANAFAVSAERSQ